MGESDEDRVARQRLELIRRTRGDEDRAAADRYAKSGKKCTPNDDPIPCDNKPHERVFGVGGPMLDMDTAREMKLATTEPYSWFNRDFWNTHNSRNPARPLSPERRWPDATDAKDKPVKYSHLGNAGRSLWEEVHGRKLTDLRDLEDRVRDRNGNELSWTPEALQLLKVNQAVDQDRDLRNKINEWLQALKCEREECTKQIQPSDPNDPLKVAPWDFVATDTGWNFTEGKNARKVVAVCIKVWVVCKAPEKAPEPRPQEPKKTERGTSVIGWPWLLLLLRVI